MRETGRVSLCVGELHRRSKTMKQISISFLLYTSYFILKQTEQKEMEMEMTDFNYCFP